jgi:methylglyoxal synthase
VQTVTVPARKRIVLIAHDRMKEPLVAWVQSRRDTLARHDLYGTGTTGRLVRDRLQLPVTCFLSGPLGGDLQVGAAIAEGRIDLMMFFWDPLTAQPHDPDVKALLRVAAVWNVPVASDSIEADFLVTSPMLDQEFPKTVPGQSDRVVS